MIRFVVMLILCAFPAFAEEHANPGFNFSTGIEIASSTGPQPASSNTSLKFIENKEHLLVIIQDFFYTAEPFDTPHLNNLSGNKGTLTISTKKKKSWIGFATKEEFNRAISIKINKSRLKKGQVIYVYNNDTGEVLGHYLVK